MLRLGPIRVAIVVLLSSVVGCTVGGGGDDAGAQTMGSTAGSFAFVQIEREVDGAPDVAAPGAVLGGAFAQYRGVEGSDVLGLLGTREAELERCVTLGADETAFADPEARVDLLDVGGLEVRVAGTRTRLAPRTFPDLAGVVGGTFYAEDATLGAARADVDEYVVSAEGGELPGFEVVVVAPPGFADVLLDGRLVAGATVDAALVDAAAVDEELAERITDQAIFEPGVPHEVEWDAGDPRDRVEIELVSQGVGIQCVARDDGTFRLPADATAALEADPEARLVLRRVRTQPFDAPGVEDAWIRVASTSTTRVTVR